MDESDYLRMHTLVSLTGLRIQNWGGDIDDYDEELDEIIEIELMTLPCKYCPSCLNEDLTLHGCGYWHREHQIAGLYACPHHQCALMLCDPEAMLKAASISSLMGVKSRDFLVKASLSPVLSRFQKMSLALSEVVHVERANESRFRRAAKELYAFRGLDLVNYKFEACVPDHVLDAVPRSWIRAHFERCEYTNGPPGYELRNAESPIWSDPYRRASWLVNLRLLSLCALAESDDHIHGLLLGSGQPNDPTMSCNQPRNVDGCVTPDQSEDHTRSHLLASELF